MTVRAKGQARADRATADEEFATLARALGHPARVRIVRLLAHAETCKCGEIVAELPLAQPTVSQHIKVLREAGIIHGEHCGACICYHVEPRALRRMVTLLGALQPPE